jgi:hypothetical protein
VDEYFENISNQNMIIYYSYNVKNNLFSVTDKSIHDNNKEYQQNKDRREGQEQK